MGIASMTVRGEAVRGEGAFPVVDPATGEPFAEAPECSPEQLDAAVAAAREAQPGWAADEPARRAALTKAAELVRAGAEELGALLTAEQGKPLAEARGEFHIAAAWLDYFAGLELPREIVQDDDAAFTEVVRRPVGVTAAITPWNFPITLAMWKIAPALRAGNTLVVKPSPYTPLATLALGELLRPVLPPGVLNVVTGSDPLGARLVGHPDVRKVSFTGSTATGKKVAESAAADLKRVTLELGGNDPAVVLPDADPEAIAESLFWGAFRNCGQICLAVKRVYVPDALHDRLAAALAAIAREVRVGPGDTAGAQLGPLNNAPQLARVTELVEDALTAGATAVAGGGRLGERGYFYSPTVVADARGGMALVDEEQFGPALPLVRYSDVADAVAAANGTNYGLTASVWSADVDRAEEVGRALDCGQVSVNVHGGAVRPNLPFGGHKWSGLGVENGPWGLHAFTELQVVTRPSRRVAAR